MTLSRKLQRQFGVDCTRDSFAAHLKYCALNSTSYFYFSNDDPNHPFSLARLCGLSSLENRSLLVAANLASINPTSNKLSIIGPAWDSFIIEYKLNKCNGVEKILPTKADTQQCFTGRKGKEKAHHLCHVGKKTANSPDSIFKQKDSASKIMNAPPTFSGMLTWQRTLLRVTCLSRLDAIVNNTGLFE